MTEDYFKDLLKTKIFIPPLREGLVPRPRLVEKLNHGANKKLFLVHAPAGYGKTTLVVEWLSQLASRHAMYSIDQNDNELSRFLTYIVFSLKQVQPDICNSVLPLIHSAEVHPTHVILAHLLNDLACIQQSTTLVIDDYHLIKSEDIHKALSFILQNLPPHLQIVLVSRKELPFSVSTLRASDQMLELNIFDLRFTKQETKAFVKGVLGLNLSYDELEEIDRKTEGWITSLQLALMGTHWKDNIERFQQLSGNDRLIASYLLDEVIHQQSSEIQDFLLKTSILDRFCAPLCNDLLEVNHCSEIINHLEKSNIFIIPLDNVGLWFRYHHLFAEFLQNRLRTNHSAAIHDLWKKASDWHAVSGTKEEAIEYSLKAEDFRSSSELIQPVVAQVLSTGGRDRVIRWLSTFPDNHLRQNHHLWPYFVLANLDRGTFGNAYKVLDRLWGKEEFIKSLPEREQPFVSGLRAGFLAAIMVHTTLDATVVKGLAQQSIDHFPGDIKFGRSIGYGHYGSACLHLGEINQARKFFDLAIEESKKEEYERLFFLWTCYRVDVEIEAGNLRQALKRIHKVLQYADERSVRESNVTSNATIGMGRILYEWNDLQQAEKFLHEGVTTAESGEYLDRLLLGYQHYFSYLMANRDFDRARQKVTHARQIAAVYDYPPIVTKRIDAFETWIDIEMGSVTSGTLLKKQLVGWPDEEINGLNEFEHHLWAKAWIAMGNYRESIRLLEALSLSAYLNGRVYSAVQIGITQAKAHALNRNTMEAKKVLGSVLELAEPEGFIRSFIDAGETILNLLRAMVVDFESAADTKSRGFLDYTKKIISEFATESRRLKKLIPVPNSEEKPALLTSREMEVIALLEEGLSYAEIAERLVITENTLKSHIKHIYSKLEARNRSEAVRNLKKTLPKR